MIDIKSFFFRGENNNLKARDKIRYYCRKTRIKCAYSIDSRNCLYYVDNTNTIIRLIFPQGLPITNPEILRRTPVTLNQFADFLEKYFEEGSEINWFWKLEPGDIVEIGERLFNSDQYPYSFVDDMTPYTGQQFKIESISYYNIPFRSDYRKLPTFNGDPALYQLEGSSYSWHSSMFVNPNDIQIQKLIISDFKLLKDL